MKKGIKTLMLAAAAVGCMSGLTACGDNFDGLTINFWHTFGKTVEDAVKTYANQFANIVREKEGVNLRIVMTYKGGYNDLKGEVSKNFATSDNPTIAVAYPDHIADYFAAETTPGEYVVDMTSLANDPEIGFGKESNFGDTEDASDFIEPYYNESVGYAREGMYSVPFLKSTEVMLYNFNLVKKAMPFYDDEITQDDEIKEFMNNLTWNEFMDFCEVIMDHKNEISDKLLWPAFYDSDANLMISQMYQRNIAYASIDKTRDSGVIGFNGIASNPTAEQTAAYQATQDLLSQYKGWYDKGLFMTKGIKGEYSSKYFVPNQTMFAIGSSGGSGYSFPSTKEFTVEACKVPYSNNNPLYVSQGVTLTLLNNKKLITSGENDDAVKYGFKFIKYLTNPTVNATLCTNSSEGYTPVRTSAYETPIYLNFKNSASDYVKTARVVVDEIGANYLVSPVFKGSATLRDQIGACFADVMKLGKNPSANDIKGKLDTAINQTVIKM